MLKIKPEYITKRGKREFVVLTVKDFDRMQEALEDADDLRALRRATARNCKGTYLTATEAKRALADDSSRKSKVG